MSEFTKQRDRLVSSMLYAILNYGMIVLAGLVWLVDSLSQYFTAHPLYGFLAAGATAILNQVITMARPWLDARKNELDARYP